MSSQLLLTSQHHFPSLPLLNVRLLDIFCTYYLQSMKHPRQHNIQDHVILWTLHLSFCSCWNLSQESWRWLSFKSATGIILPTLYLWLSYTIITKWSTIVRVSVVLNRCLQLPAPYKQLVDDINNRQTTDWPTTTHGSKRTNHCLQQTNNRPILLTIHIHTLD